MVTESSRPKVKFILKDMTGAASHSWTRVVTAIIVVIVSLKVKPNNRIKVGFKFKASIGMASLPELDGLSQ